MPADSDLYLDDILESIRRIEAYTTGFDAGAFAKNQMVQDAVCRNLAVIGEAVKKLPSTLRDTQPEIEWRKIAGLRDILVHEYANVEVEIVWDIVETKLAPLATAIRRMKSP